MDELDLSEEVLGEEIDHILSTFTDEDLNNTALNDPNQTTTAAEPSQETNDTDKSKSTTKSGGEGDGEGEGEVSAKELERRREGNRRRCRKFRERRRLEEKQVYEENLSLKRERADLLDKITELEYNVQALRGQGVLDLSKENELLKQEIKKHRVYIERVVEAVVNTPLETTNVENTRMMTSAAESAVSQVVGLMYSSMNEKSWNTAKTLEVDPGDGAPLQTVVPRWQYLPIGATIKDARRVNIRTDFIGVGVTAAALADYFWSIATRIDMLQAKFRSVPHLKGFELHEVYKKTRVTENEEIQCISMSRPEGNGRSEGVFVAALKEVDVHPMAYGETMDGTAPLETAKIFTTSTCNVNIETEELKGENVERIQDISIEGILFRNVGENSASVTTITSTPGSGWFHRMLCEDLPVIDDNGEMNAYYVEMLKMQMRAFNEYSKAFEAQGVE